MTYFKVVPDVIIDDRDAEERPLLLVMAFNGTQARRAAAAHIDGVRRYKFVTRPVDLRGYSNSNSELLVDPSFWGSSHRMHWGLAGVMLLQEWGFMR